MGPIETFTVLFSVKVNEDYDPMIGVKAKTKDVLNVIELARQEYIIVRDEKRYEIGYFPIKLCVKQIRKAKEQVSLPKDLYLQFLDMKKWSDEEKDSIMRIQRWYRRIKERKVIYKKLDNFGERLFSKSELVENDSNYLVYLEAVNSMFFEPLKDVLTVEEHDGIFANFGEVIVCAREVNKNLTTIGVLGLKNVIEQLSVNSKYISNYSEAMETFKKLRLGFERTPNAPNSVKFLDTMNKAERDERACGLDFQNLMIKPFQRLVTYQNIVGQILKRTPKESHEFALISGILQDVKSLCGEVNQERRVKMDQKWMKDTNVYAVGRKLVFKDSIFPVELSTGTAAGTKDRFNGSCYLFNDLLFVKKDKEESFSFYFFLTQIQEDQQQKKWLECKSIYRTARVLFKKKKEKTSWLESIGKNMTKVNILMKRRHGIPNIGEYVDKYKFVRTKKNEQFEERLKELQDKKNKEIMEISYKKKQNHFIKILFRTKVAEMVKNLEEILGHTAQCDVLSVEMNKIREEKKENVKKMLSMLAKFRECMDNDIVEFYKIFEEDQSYATTEMENLKKKIKKIDNTKEVKQLSRCKKILGLALNPLDQLDHYVIELERREEELEDLKLRVQIIDKIESKFEEIKEKRVAKEKNKKRRKTIMMSMDDDDDKPPEDVTPTEEETEGEGEKQKLELPDIREEVKTKIIVKQKICMVTPELIDDYANLKYERLKKKMYEKNKKINTLSKRVEDLEIAKEVEKEISQERIAELVSQLEEEKAKLSGFQETVELKTKTNREIKKRMEKLVLENNQLKKKLGLK